MLLPAEPLSESTLACPLSHVNLGQPKTAICFASDDAASLYASRTYHSTHSHLVFNMSCSFPVTNADFIELSSWQERD
jgi:hypothetical protein